VKKKALLILVLFLIGFSSNHCSSVNHRDTQAIGTQSKSCDRSLKKLTPKQLYAAEVLAYFFKVVVGKAENQKLSEEWAARGVTAPLNFSDILHIMNATGNGRSSIASNMKAPSQSKSDYIVQDPYILGLGEVLYYYDLSLNQYKGRYAFDSIYPSPELIALRTLLARKIHRNEKIRLGRLFERKKLLTDRTEEPTPKDLEEMHLDAEEFQLVKDVIATDPCLEFYMENPFLISALLETGVIEEDVYVQKKARQATYSNCPCRHFSGSLEKSAIKISFLPSVIKEFKWDTARETGRFEATDFYRNMLEKLQAQIAEYTKSLAIKELRINIDHDVAGWDMLWDQLFQRRVAFYSEDTRPLVIHPENVETVVRQVCPETDFAVIILGKNVYLSMGIDPEKHVYPSTNRIYLDIIDIKYSQTNAELESISRFILSKLKDDMIALLKIRD
jgi:hypothetical protein